MPFVMHNKPLATEPEFALRQAWCGGSWVASDGAGCQGNTAHDHRVGTVRPILQYLGKGEGLEVEPIINGQ